MLNIGGKMEKEMKSLTFPLKNFPASVCTNALSMALPIVPPTIKAKPTCPQTLRVRLRHSMKQNTGVPNTVMIKNTIFAASLLPMPKEAPSLYTA